MANGKQLKEMLIHLSPQQSDRNEPKPTDESKSTEHCLANDLMDRIWLLVKD